MKKTILKSAVKSLCVGLVFCLLLSAAFFEHRSSRQSEEQLRTLAYVLERADEEAFNPAARARQLSRLAGGLRVTLIAADGTVLGDSETSPHEMESHAQREEVLEAKENGSGVDVRQSKTLGRRLNYAAIRTEGGEYIRVSAPDQGFWRTLLRIFPVFLAVGLFAFFAAEILLKRATELGMEPLAQFTKTLSAAQQSGSRLNPADYPYEELQTMAVAINGLFDEGERNLHHLERERAKIDYILDNMNEGFVLMDTDRNILLINAAACRCFGASKAAVQGKSLVHATHNISLLDGVSAVLQKGGHVAVDLPLPDKRRGEANISRVMPEDTGAIDGGVILIITDVTAQRNAAQMRQEFFESASHELKTPITSIRGFAELLCSKMPLSSVRREEISQRILKETTRMSSLIGDIIMISRLESGDITFEREVLDLAAVVKECCTDIQNLAGEADVSIECSTQPCVISASHKEMRELAGNLISNAVKYNRPGGSVQVTLNCEGGAPCLSVFNTGEPIPREYVGRIFERFYRIDRGRSKAAGGTGLGLAIVKHIATNYGASVSVAPSREGNIFTVRFPRENKTAY